MQEGSLRVDANVNLHLQQDGALRATPIVEVKNMNSFRAVGRAIEYEGERQYAVWQETGRALGDPGVTKETRGWDDAAGVTRPQRSKEESSDYRYFPEPDLPPVVITHQEIQAYRDLLGELPADLRSRLMAQYNLSAYDSDVLVNQGRPLVDFFQQVADFSGEGKVVSNWIQQDVLRFLSETSQTIAAYPVKTDTFAQLLQAVAEEKLTTGRGREVLAKMVTEGESLEAAMASLGIAEVDTEETEQLCRELLAANPQVVADLKNGKQKAVGALIGQAKRRNPNIQPGQVQEICLRLADQM